MREGSSYAEALRGVKVQDIRIKTAPSTMQTFDLMQKVGRGEEKVTVADSDLFAASIAFTPNIRAAFKLVEKQPIAWGMRRNASNLKVARDSFLIEYALTLSQGEIYWADLDEIKQRKVLRVLTRNASSTFFIYKGEQLGFEYEMAQEFAKSLGVRLEMIIPPSREALFEYLEGGERRSHRRRHDAHSGKRKKISILCPLSVRK